MILLDTAPVVALCDPRDALNAIAARDLDRLSHQTLVACEAVLTEACALLWHPVQRRRLRRFVEEFSVEHEPDWADGYLAVVSGRQRRFRVWTYDREFKTTWRRPDGTRIPLAVS